MERSSIIEALWDLSEELGKCGSRQELDHIGMRENELLSLLSTAERKLWGFLGLSNEIYQVDTLVVNGSAKGLKSFFDSLPTKSCVWPSYPFGPPGANCTLTELPALNDPACQLWQHGFQRGEWQQITFLPCTAHVGDLVAICEQNIGLFTSWVGGSRFEFSGWMQNILRALGIVEWLGFEVGEEAGSLVTFWSNTSRSLLDSVIATLKQKSVKFGAAVRHQGQLDWLDFGLIE